MPTDGYRAQESSRPRHDPGYHESSSSCNGESSAGPAQEAANGEPHGLFDAEEEVISLPIQNQAKYVTNAWVIFTGRSLHQTNITPAIVTMDDGGHDALSRGESMAWQKVLNVCERHQ